MITLGSLRQRIEIQQLSTLADGQGGHVTSWTTIDTVWAKIEPNSGGERVYGQKIEDTYDHKIFIRNHAGLNTSMRIFFNNRYFHIKGIIREEERRWYMKIYAKEGEAS